MLREMYSRESLERDLVRVGQYRPYATVDERQMWERLPEALRVAHGRSADMSASREMRILPASLFLAYLAETDSSKARDRYEAIYYPRRSGLEQLVIAECIWNDGRYLMSILDHLWAILEESYWGVPGHVFRQKAGRTLPDVVHPNVDLFSAETAGLVAWTFFLLGSRLSEISPVILPRIEHEIRHRILDPCLEHDFHWMGFNRDPDKGRRPNNWNPWICSNWLTCVLIVESEHGRRVRGVHRVARALDNFIVPYPADGGCDEGPQYWDKAAGCLFDALESLEGAVRTPRGVFKEEKIRNIGRYLSGVHIADHYFANFADSDAVLDPDGPLAYAYGDAVNDNGLRDLGAYLIRSSGLAEIGYARGMEREQNVHRMLRGLTLIGELDPAGAEPPLARDTWFPDIEVMTARDRAGSADGLYIACKGGHNRESHNHNDVGSFVVYCDGRPLIVDAGVERYTGLTFGPLRYTLWPMRSAYHSLLPLIGEYEQEFGFEFRSSGVSYDADEDAATFGLDISQSYAKEAIRHWRRTIVLRRNSEVTVTDDYSLVDAPQPIDVAFLTPCSIDVSEAGLVRLRSRNYWESRCSADGVFRYDGSLFVAAAEQLAITDTRMKAVWGETLNRVVLKAESPPLDARLVYRISGAT